MWSNVVTHKTPLSKHLSYKANTEFVRLLCGQISVCSGIIKGHKFNWTHSWSTPDAFWLVDEQMAGYLFEFCTVLLVSLCPSVHSARALFAPPAENRRSSFNKLNDRWKVRDPFVSCVCVFAHMCVILLWKAAPFETYTHNSKETSTINPHFFLKQQYFIFWHLLPQLCSAVSLNNCLLVLNCVCICRPSGWVYMNCMSMCIIHPLWRVC